MTAFVKEKTLTGFNRQLTNQESRNNQMWKRNFQYSSPHSVDRKIIWQCSREGLLENIGLFAYLRNLCCCILRSGCHSLCYCSPLHCCILPSPRFPTGDSQHHCCILLFGFHFPRQSSCYHEYPGEDLYRYGPVSGIQPHMLQNNESNCSTEGSSHFLPKL